MARYAMIGTTATKTKKRYAMIGTTATKTKKRYAMIGTTATLVYSAELNLLEDTSWSKYQPDYSTCTISASKVSIETTEPSIHTTLYKQVDVTDYDTLTITCNISNVQYAWVGVGLVSDYSNTGEPVVGERLSDTDGDILNVSDTFEFNVKELTGNYYFSLFAYRGSGRNPKVEVTKAILS